MSREQLSSEIGEWQTVPSFELEENSRYQLHDFRASLSRASDACYRILTEEWFDLEMSIDLDHPDKPANKLIAQDIKEQLRHTGNEFYTTQEFRWLEDASLTHFDVIRSAKAETSAHGVFFGIMTNKETGESLAVAVKPCVQKPEKAYLDWLNNGLIARTERKHFAPVGFIYDSDRAYSMTLLQKGVETLDNTDWRYVLMDPESPSYIGQREQLTDIGIELAGLHEERIFHGDPQFKNIAIDPTGETYFIDWEAAKFFGKNATADVLRKKAAHDLEVLYYSMAAPVTHNGVGLLAPYDRRLQWAHFNNFILTPYLERRMEMDDRPANIEVLNEIESQIKEYALKEFSVGSLKRFLTRTKG
jgi:hypothetical protein